MQFRGITCGKCFGRNVFHILWKLAEKKWFHENWLIENSMKIRWNSEMNFRKSLKIIWKILIKVSIFWYHLLFLYKVTTVKLLFSDISH